MRAEAISQELLKDTYATKGGRISPWGTIRILLNSTPDEGGGLECWSRAFFKWTHAPKGPYSAEVGSNCVKILSRSRAVVETVHRGEIFYLTSSNYVVSDSGWLLMPDEQIRVEIALNQAERGIKPCYLDNSRFLKVSPKLKGQELKVLEFEVGIKRNEQFLVFRKGGAEVPFEASAPLAFARWKKKDKKLAHSKSR